MRRVLTAPLGVSPDSPRLSFTPIKENIFKSQVAKIKNHLKIKRFSNVPKQSEECELTGLQSEFVRVCFRRRVDPRLVLR